jgi:hypothetical protein
VRKRHKEKERHKEREKKRKRAKKNGDIWIEKGSETQIEKDETAAEEEKNENLHY